MNNAVTNAYQSERPIYIYMNICIYIRVAEPEPPGAGLFGWSRSLSRKKYEVSAPAPGEL